MSKFLTWLLFLIPSILIGWLFRLVSPFACLFVNSYFIRTTVKRLNKQEILLKRVRLQRWLFWFDTHDNCTDEWWYGMYNTDSSNAKVKAWTQNDYDQSPFIRWYCRMRWLQRNSAYGFNYHFFSKPSEADLSIFERGNSDLKWWIKYTHRVNSFQLQANHPWPFTQKYNSINIGWKKHKQQTRMLFAGRILSFKG